MARASCVGRRARSAAERGPLDLLAYLEALDAPGRPGVTAGSARALRSLTARAHAHVDLLVVLPLAGTIGVSVPDEEDAALREAADTALLDLLDDDELLPASTTVLEVGGDRSRRVGTVLDVLARRVSR
ncbi:hypothetical protein LG324_11700 [Phycicoccus jejuensis]|uniref:hypothetical protein n=1 Tax=Phycicoccus jejuensis TaxID=367299 RepID=UPI00384DDBAF